MLPLGTVPTGHGPVIGSTPVCCDVGSPGAAGVEPEDGFAFEDPAGALAGFGAVVPVALTHGLTGATGVPGFPRCAFPDAPVAGVGTAPVGAGLSALALGGVAPGVSSPAAFVVIGVGGPMVFVGGVIPGAGGGVAAFGVGTVGLGAAAFGTVACLGAVVAAGGGGAGVAVGVRWAATQLAQHIRRGSTIIRCFIGTSLRATPQRLRTKLQSRFLQVSNSREGQAIRGIP